MVKITTAEILKAFLVLAVSIVIASVLALFSGVFYEPELAAEHRENAQKIFSSKEVLSQEELDKITTPILQVEVGRPTYNLWDDFVAGFRGGSLWLVVVHVALLLLVRPRISETAVVSIAAFCFIVLALPWPNPALAVVLSTFAYGLVGWFKSEKKTG